MKGTHCKHLNMFLSYFNSGIGNFQIFCRILRFYFVQMVTNPVKEKNQVLTRVNKPGSGLDVCIAFKFCVA